MQNVNKIYSRADSGKTDRFILLSKGTEGKSNDFMPIDLELEKGADDYYRIVTAYPNKDKKIEGILIFDDSTGSSSVAATDSLVPSTDNKSGVGDQHSANAKISIPTISENITQPAENDNVKNRIQKRLQAFKTGSNSLTNEKAAVSSISKILVESGESEETATLQAKKIVKNFVDKKIAAEKNTLTEKNIDDILNRLFLFNRKRENQTQDETDSAISNVAEIIEKSGIEAKAAQREARRILYFEGYAERLIDKPAHESLKAAGLEGKTTDTSFSAGFRDNPKVVILSQNYDDSAKNEWDKISGDVQKLADIFKAKYKFIGGDMNVYFALNVIRLQTR